MHFKVDRGVKCEPKVLYGDGKVDVITSNVLESTTRFKGVN